MDFGNAKRYLGVPAHLNCCKIIPATNLAGLGIILRGYSKETKVLFLEVWAVRFVEIRRLKKAQKSVLFIVD